MAVLKSRESLAVKYRPRCLEQLIGQEEVISLLQGQFRSKMGINRSFLISGPTGVGKTSLGRILAHYINCENFDIKTCTPCGTCDYCKDVNERNYYGGVDEINFSDTRGIDTVRAIIESTVYASEHNAKVFICDEIQCITGIAQNALLKILEEPPDGVILLLLTTDPQKLLPTIINRCCPLSLKRVEDEQVANYLLKIVTKEKRDYFTPEDLSEDPKEKAQQLANAYAVFKNIAMFSNGLMRQAIATLEAVLSMVEGGEKIDTQDVETNRKIVGRFVESPETEPNIAMYLISGLYSGRYGISLSYANKLMSTGQSASCKYLFEKAMDYHLQTLYFLVDPKLKIANLCDPFYSRWNASLLEAVKQPGGLQLVHQSAAEMVGLFMELLSEMSSYVHNERRLVIAFTLKMLDAVSKYKHLAYTKSSVFHKTHAPDLLEADE